MNLTIEVLTTVLSIALVLLISFNSFPRFWLSVIAASIAAMIALEKIGNFGRRWFLYRLSAEALQSEVQLFTHRAGPYAGETTDGSRLLVERVEGLLNQEAGKWHEISKTTEPSLERKLGT